MREEIAGHAGRHDEAVAALREAVAIEDAIPYNEPPVWHHPTRQVPTWCLSSTNGAEHPGA